MNAASTTEDDETVSGAIVFAQRDQNPSDDVVQADIRDTEHQNEAVNEESSSLLTQLPVSDTRPRDARIIEHKRLFEERMKAKLLSAKRANSIMTKTKYDKLIHACMNWESLCISDRKQVGYRTVRKFYVMVGLHGPQLYWRKKQIDGEEHQSVLHTKNVFDAVREVHTNCNHGKARTLMYEMRRRYSRSVPEWLLREFTAVCPDCIETRLIRKHLPAGHNPILSKNYGERGQADLIDYQSMAFNGLKYLLVYQDHFSKLVDCRSLPDKKKSTVARALLDIFLLLGAPRILQTDNGKEFVGLALDCPLAEWDVGEVIEEISLLWPECKMVHGAPRHSPSQGSVERANRKFREHIRAWLHTNRENECRDDWPLAAVFAKYHVNTAYHHGLKNPPYKLVFGQDPICGIRGLPLLSDDVAQVIHTEEDLAMFYASNPNADLSKVRVKPHTPCIQRYHGTTRDNSYVSIPRLRESEIELTDEENKSDTPSTNALDHDLSIDEDVTLYQDEGERAVHGNEEACDTTSPMIKFCDDCKKRVYTDIAQISSTHLNCGDDEAMCTCRPGQKNLTTSLPVDAREFRLTQMEESEKDDSETHREEDESLIKITPTEEGSEEARDTSSPLIKFCDDCKKRVYADISQISSTHLSCGDDEAMCTCKTRQKHQTDVSPRRAVLRRKAAKAMAGQAHRMQTRARKAQNVTGDLEPGMICKIDIKELDRLNADAATITVVVVEKTRGGLYRLACEHGVLKRCLYRSYIEILPGATRELVGLEEMYENWKKTRRITIREAARAKAVAVNARLRCNCQGSCTTSRCRCLKAGLKCKSSCHRGSDKCKNKH